MDRATFLRNVGPLFEETLDREGDAYDDVIYHVERPLTERLVASARAFVGRDGDPGTGIAGEVDEAVANAHYPDTSSLLKLQSQGFDLPGAVACLHFYQPHFPLYREAAVDGLGEVGYDVAWTTELTEEGLAAYADYEQAVHELMEAIHFRYMPEIHCYRQRVVEGALTALNRS